MITTLPQFLHVHEDADGDWGCKYWMYFDSEEGCVDEVLKDLNQLIGEQELARQELLPLGTVHVLTYVNRTTEEVKILGVYGSFEDAAVAVRYRREMHGPNLAWTDEFIHDRCTSTSYPHAYHVDSVLFRRDNKATT